MAHAKPYTGAGGARGAGGERRSGARSVGGAGGVRSAGGERGVSSLQGAPIQLQNCQLLNSYKYLDETLAIIASTRLRTR